MAEACLLSLPSLFCNKTKHPHSSTFPSKPLKLQLSCSNSSLFLPSTSLIGRTHSSSILTFVAQTSDAAQQEADDAVAVGDEEPAWENQEVDNTEAGVSDWEAEGGEEGEYVEASEDAKIYVGNLPYDVDSQKLAMLFEQAGTVEIAEVIYNRETDRSRGFGFVTMSTVEEAEIAIEKFSRYDLNGRLLTVNKAAPRGSRPERPPRAFEPAFRIHVGNLPWDVDNAGLEQMFRDQGKVLNARIVYDRETGRSRGFGFITMATETEMNNAIAALDGQSVDGRAIRVSAAEERPRRGNF